MGLMGELWTGDWAGDFEVEGCVKDSSSQRIDASLFVLCPLPFFIKDSVAGRSSL